MNDSGINTLFDNIGKKIIIPEYDYKNTDSNAQKEFIKRAKEKSNEQKIDDKEGHIKLEKKDTIEIKEKNKKKCC